MKINFSKGKIQIEKRLNSLDKFALNFSSILKKLNIKYVLISGYVSILFGRARSSEDIDLIIEKLDAEKFHMFWKDVNKKYNCINTSKEKEAYENYLLEKIPIRFSEKEKFIPNVELKFPENEIEKWVLKNSLLVVLNEKKIKISSIELQIAFKLFLGTEKDIEDAKYLFKIFNKKIDEERLNYFVDKMKVRNKFKRYFYGSS